MQLNSREKQIDDLFCAIIYGVVGDGRESLRSIKELMCYPAHFIGVCHATPIWDFFLHRLGEADNFAATVERLEASGAESFVRRRVKKNFRAAGKFQNFFVLQHAGQFNVILKL